MDVKEIIKYIAIAAGIYVVWEYVISPMMGSSTAAAATPVSPTITAAGSAPIVTTTPIAPVTPPAAAPPTGVTNNTFTSSDYGSTAWQARVASAMAIAAGGNGTQNFDDWSWFYQNGGGVGGSPISATLMQQIINAGGGNRAALITAPQFVGYLVQAYQPALSGMGDIIYTGSVGLSGLGNFYRLG
jgi:hypothetical protein